MAHILKVVQSLLVIMCALLVPAWIQGQLFSSSLSLSTMLTEMEQGTDADWESATNTETGLLIWNLSQGSPRPGWGHERSTLLRQRGLFRTEKSEKKQEALLRVFSSQDC